MSTCANIVRLPVSRNRVTPCRERLIDKDGKPYLGDYQVDGDEVPMLVGRGVVPFRFLRMREDFASRFGDCKDGLDVLKVLKREREAAE